MAKERITPCKFYICEGECTEGREAEHNGFCQRCRKYKPRAFEKHLNRKKEELEKVRKKEFKELEWLENVLYNYGRISLKEWCDIISIQKKIDMACAHAGISRSELSRRLGYKYPEAFTSRYRVGKFTQEEMEKIAIATGGKYISLFSYPDGTEF